MRRGSPFWRGARAGVAHLPVAPARIVRVGVLELTWVGSADRTAHHEAPRVRLEAAHLQLPPVSSLTAWAPPVKREAREAWHMGEWREVLSEPAAGCLFRVFIISPPRDKMRRATEREATQDRHAATSGRKRQNGTGYIYGSFCYPGLQPTTLYTRPTEPWLKKRYILYCIRCVDISTEDWAVSPPASRFTPRFRSAHVTRSDRRTKTHHTRPEAPHGVWRLSRTHRAQSPWPHCRRSSPTDHIHMPIHDVRSRARLAAAPLTRSRRAAHLESHSISPRRRRRSWTSCSMRACSASGAHQARHLVLLVRVVGQIGAAGGAVRLLACPLVAPPHDARLPSLLRIAATRRGHNAAGGCEAGPRCDRRIAPSSMGGRRRDTRCRGRAREEGVVGGGWWEGWSGGPLRGWRLAPSLSRRRATRAPSPPCAARRRVPPHRPARTPPRSAALGSSRRHAPPPAAAPPHRAATRVSRRAARAASAGRVCGEGVRGGCAGEGVRGGVACSVGCPPPSRERR